jgi:hypothetical protein
MVQRSLARTLAAAAFAVSLATACVPVPVPVSVEDGNESFRPVAALASGEAVVVLGAGEADGDWTGLPQCVRGELASARRGLRLVSPAAFRAAIQPWSVPQLLAWTEEEWSSELRESEVGQTVAALNARYAVFVRGETSGEAEGVDPADLPVSAGWISRKSEVSVTVVDLKNATTVGTETATASGGGPVAIVGVGLYSLAETESAACAHVAARLAAIFAGTHRPESAKAK